MSKQKEIEIRLDRRNYRKHGEENKRIIKKSLEELGEGRSIVIDAEGEIIAGNGGTHGGGTNPNSNDNGELG